MEFVADGLLPRALSQWGEETLIRRTLMQRDRELAEFEIDPTTGKACVIDIANDDLVASAGLARQNRDRVLTALIERRALSISAIT